MSTVFIGIIGGSGLENPDVLQGSSDHVIETPFGTPSDIIKIGTIDGVRCAVLSRHGRKHSISPTNINYRANIWALKQLGCTHILATTACGSLREQIAPGEMVIIDQFIDRTSKRHLTFFDNTDGGPPGVCHIPMNPPFCNSTREIVINAASQLGIKCHTSGTLICIEGPRFSTKAESNLYRNWGADVIGMTLVPEVCLAKEAAICYASIALPTDYDCWREEIGGVNVESVMATFAKHCDKAIQVLKLSIKLIAQKDWTKEWKEYSDIVKRGSMDVD